MVVHICSILSGTASLKEDTVRVGGCGVLCCRCVDVSFL